jgi:kumamolisin
VIIMSEPYRPNAALIGTEHPLCSPQSRVHFLARPGEKAKRDAEKKSARAKAEPAIEVTIFVRSQRHPDWGGLATEALAAGSTVDRAQLRRAFKADEQEVDRVATAMRMLGLKVLEADALTRRVVVRGAPEEIADAFGVELGEYRHEGNVYRGYEGRIQVPADVAEFVDQVVGLDNFPVARWGKVNTLDGTFKYPPPRYTAPQLASLYNFPPDLTGKNQTVGIVVLLGGFHQEDLDQYFSEIGLPVPKIAVVGKNQPASRAALRKAIEANSEAGCPPEPGADSASLSAEVRQAMEDGSLDWTFETTMDVELVGTFANRAQIVVYILGGFDARTIINGLVGVLTGTEYRPAILSASWGFPEEFIPTRLLRFLDEVIIKGLAALGVTMCFAAGDDGSTDGGTKLQTLYPASSAYVVACGGTSLEATDGTITKETVWNSVGATGGGVSEVFRGTFPWQKTAEVKKKTGWDGRGVPDVAGNADPLTGCKMILGGCIFVTNGTSAVAPLWAGLLGRLYEALEGGLGWITPILYEPTVAASFNDITEGNNILKGSGVTQYTALPGWDACTGWGSPNGTKLLEALAEQVAGQTARQAARKLTRQTARKLIIVDMKNCTERHVRALRSGRGKLVDRIQGLADDLSESGEIKDNTEILVIVFERWGGSI